MVRIEKDAKSFCCQGCLTVYDLLSSSGSNEYYRLSEHPGIKSTGGAKRFDFLDNAEIRSELLDFSEGGISRVKFYIPNIHCSSCIWLLENLHRLDPGILQSAVQFTKKEATFTFRDNQISLRGLVELLSSLNYSPLISLDSLDNKKGKKENREILYRLGVAGFCFGNIMLFSFPHYLAVDDAIENFIRSNFGILNILLGIPVAFYSGSSYFVSAIKGLKKRFISIDLPIAIGILALFFRSCYEILSGTGAGFMDSLAGLLFFLLIGKWYQGLTYQALSFERDYRSYFPVAVTLIAENGEESVLPIRHLKPGMKILIRNDELIPADSVLVTGEAAIDYSFVSGESSPVFKSPGERIYAGGRQSGPAIEVLVEKEVSQSRLTELWNQEHSEKKLLNRLESLIDVTAKYFTMVVMGIAFAAAIVWWFKDPSRAVPVVTAVLIVACPCALAMTIPFSFGGAMRVFGRNGFYVKRSSVVETLSRIDTVVLDKTGTLTKTHELSVESDFAISDNERADMIRSLARHSTHPVSVAVYNALPERHIFEVLNFREIPNKGCEGMVNGCRVRIGSGEFISGTREPGPNRLFVAIDGVPAYSFVVRHRYRDGMEDVLRSLGGRYELHLLSGDNDSEFNHLRVFFSETNMKFNQNPKDKLEYVRNLITSGRRVLMIGDGLNDAGALKESHCGISIADDVFHFSPSCDAILESIQFGKISAFIDYSRTSRRIVLLAMIFSFFYNIIGLSFAVTGNLTPVISAILMPLSSVSVILLITSAIWLSARKKFGPPAYSVSV
jgi:Cu+-exporting ATPase